MKNLPSLMSKEFEMRMMGDLNFFVQLQVKQDGNIHKLKKVCIRACQEVWNGKNQGQRFPCILLSNLTKIRLDKILIKEHVKV